MKPVKKGQLQMFETIAVLFVFFILIAIGFIFYGRIMKGNIEAEAEEARSLKSIAIAQRAMFLPELQCSEDNIIKDNCIDMLKIDAAKKIIRLNEAHYYDMFEFSSINITKIYPSYSSYSIYSREVPYKLKFTTNIPISLFNASSNEYYFGIMSVETYSR